LIERRVRYWTTNGVLRTIGELHTGRGRSRQFDVEEVYVAALLVELADKRLSLEALKAVAEIIRWDIAQGGENAALWEQAKRWDRDGRTVWLAVSEILDEAAERPVSTRLRFATSNRLLSPSFPYEAEKSMITVLVSGVLAEVRLL
jgi:hypothetical protein